MPPVSGSSEAPKLVPEPLQPPELESQKNEHDAVASGLMLPNAKTNTVMLPVRGLQNGVQK
jgi:hypothetical protein